MKGSRTKKINSSMARCLFLAVCAALLVGHWLWRLPVHAQSPDPARRVYAPYFEGEVITGKQAVFWFGQVDSTNNYADVRIGYDENQIILYLHVFDRWLWYDTTPSVEDLTAWDAATLYLGLDGDSGNVPTTNTYRFATQLSGQSEQHADYQAAYRGDGSDWVAAPTPFTTKTGWRGNGLNDGTQARGWWVKFSIPFASLDLSGPPLSGSVWGLALALHDRDDTAGTSIPDQTWPEEMEAQRPVTWGQLVFGLPVFRRPFATPGDVVTVRHGLNGASVVDGHVGGHSTCGQGLDFWGEWGAANYANYQQINIQNQWDVADWPCFSKYYVTFPLEDIPAGKAIISATLRLYHFGDAGAGYDSGPQPSLIQVLTVSEDWDEATLAWNNAPLAVENVSGAWVDPLDSLPAWPGVAREWDVSRAVAGAYAMGDPLRLALYEADTAYHSGKYFYSSDAGESGRPSLQVLWGDPKEVVGQVYLPLIVSR